MIDVRSNRWAMGRRLRVLVGAIASVAGAGGGRPTRQRRCRHRRPAARRPLLPRHAADGRLRHRLRRQGAAGAAQAGIRPGVGVPAARARPWRSMRPAGSPATDEAVLRVSADLAANTSYTFAAFGRQAELNTDLLTDDLSAPPPGQGRVRLIQAAIDGCGRRQHRGRPLLAQDADLGSVGNYVAVPAGAWEVTAEGDSADPVVENLTVEPGAVSSLVVLDGNGTGNLQIISVNDAAGATAGAGVAPAGGVDTGGGGLAREIARSADSAGTGGALVATSAGLLAVLLAVGTTRLLRRRRAT